MTNDPQKSDILTERLLDVRQYAIGLAVATERLLETMGHPVDSAIVTRAERRYRVKHKYLTRDRK